MNVETRYRYNPDIKSLPAMTPAVMPLLLLLIPAMLTALSVVREKELGSIVNLYVTPVTRSEFLIGKQIPYIVLAMLNYFMMCLIIVTLFDVPVKGSFYPHSCCISVCDFCHRDGFIGIHSDQKSDCVNVFGDDWDVGACHAICRDY